LKEGSNGSSTFVGVQKSEQEQQLPDSTMPTATTTPKTHNEEEKVHTPQVAQLHQQPQTQTAKKSGIHKQQDDQNKAPAPDKKKRRMMIPMSREDYEAQQSVVREVYDEESGRYRLVRGNGEIIERIVSRSDHQRINQTATQGDGSSFSDHVFAALQKR